MLISAPFKTKAGRLNTHEIKNTFLSTFIKMEQKRKPAVGFIFITLLLDVMGWGIIIPVMPKLIASLKHIPVADASPYGAWLISAYAITQFVCAPIVGNLSDKFGRRPVILISLFGFAVDYMFLAFAPTYSWLFVGRVIAGVTGASITTASAYIADVSTPETRAKNFGLIGAAFGLGFIIGPTIGGLLGEISTRAPFYGASILCMLNFLYGYFVLPESLPKDKRRKFEWKRANPLGAMRVLIKHPEIGGLALSFFLIYMAVQSVQSNWNYFTMAQFDWKPRMVGISLGVIGVLVAIVQGGLIRIINPRLGNNRSVYTGLLLYSIGLFLFSFATQGWMIFVFLIPYCLGGIAGPAIQAILAGHVPANEQGEMQGAMTSMMSLTSIIGPPIMNYLFFYCTRPNAVIHFPGAPFFLGGIFMLASAFIAYTVLRKEKKVALA